MIRSRWYRAVRNCALWALAVSLASPGLAQDSPGLPIAQLEADPAIPTIQTITGHDWATHITTHSEMERYLNVLVAAAPDRARLERYGESYEGRGLYYLVISSAENMQRLEEIRLANLRLADPQQPASEPAPAPAPDMPALIWLAASVHGNELSSTEAALVTAYHLLADQRSATKELLGRLVILIDPLQNPDGRARFLNVYREHRGAFDSSHPLSSEHAERWPGGRFNHYWFDMNRDWFLQSQQETLYKVRAYRHWQPQIYVDAHEMGHNSTYFFVPPTDPINPFILSTQKDWLWKLGRQQAEWFDRYGFSYTTREMFDAFYPGYGSEWPTLQGGLGVLWEQAGVRGLSVDRDDETTLRYVDSVLHHYVSALATLELAAAHREQLLANFQAAGVRGIELGEGGPVKHFVLPARLHRDRTVRLVQLLERNGVRVQQVTGTMRVSGTDMRNGKKVQRTVSPGSFVVPVAQPAGRLVRMLLDRHVEMDKAYVERQLARKYDHLPDQIYDVTAWSLPLAFDVPCLATDQTILADSVREASVRSEAEGEAGAEPLPQAQVAYLVRPTDNALFALTGWLEQGLRVHVTDEPFVFDQRKFPRGTLIVKTNDNPERLHEVLQASARQFDLPVVPVDTGLVAEGSHFGGPHVKWVRPPKILLAVDRPTSYSVGHTWYLFDQVWRYPTTRVSCRHLEEFELGKVNVVIIPDGSYLHDAAFGKDLADRLRLWVRDGGTLVLVANAAVWASQEKIGLLQLKRVRHPDAKPVADRPADVARREEPSDDDETPDPRWPDSVPGAFLRANVFQQHWLTFGCPPSLNVFFQGDVFFEPLAIEDGRNVITFAQRDPLVAAGFCWPKTEQVLGGKTWLAYKPVGKGHIVAFAADPNFRAMYPSLQRVFLNACLFGPGE